MFHKISVDLISTTCLDSSSLFSLSDVRIQNLSNTATWISHIISSTASEHPPKKTQNRQSFLPRQIQATPDIPNAYNPKTTIAHPSETYIVGMDRLMSPVATFAYQKTVHQVSKTKVLGSKIDNIKTNQQKQHQAILINSFQ